LSPDEFVVMPNHIHGIAWITEVGAHGRAPLQKTLHRQPRSLASFIAGFKSITTKLINGHRATPGVPVWQRNYYEHIIRGDHALNQIREIHRQQSPAMGHGQGKPRRGDMDRRGARPCARAQGRTVAGMTGSSRRRVYHRLGEAA